MKSGSGVVVAVDVRPGGRASPRSGNESIDKNKKTGNGSGRRAVVGERHEYYYDDASQTFSNGRLTSGGLFQIRDAAERRRVVNSEEAAGRTELGEERFTPSPPPPPPHPPRSVGK